MSMSMRETLSPKDTQKMTQTFLEPRAAAAVGQSGLMALYDAMFTQYGVNIAQVLVTKPDFYNPVSRVNLRTTFSELLALNIVPIVNTNDAVVSPSMPDFEHATANGDNVQAHPETPGVSVCLECNSDCLRTRSNNCRMRRLSSTTMTASLRTSPSKWEPTFSFSCPTWTEFTICHQARRDRDSCRPSRPSTMK